MARCSRRLLPLLLLFAFLPTLTFLGHWHDLLGQAPPALAPASIIVDGAAQRAEAAEHAMHCHTNLGSCSAQPLPAGLGLLATHEALFALLLAYLIGRVRPDAHIAGGRIVPPPSPPPRGR